MFGTNKEILNFLLLIVVGYCIDKMFSRSYNRFSVGNQQCSDYPEGSCNPPCKWTNNTCKESPHSPPFADYEYKIYEPDPYNYPDPTTHAGVPDGLCGYTYENNKANEGSYRPCDAKHTCVCLTKNNKIVTSKKGDFDTCSPGSVPYSGAIGDSTGRCMSNIKLGNIKKQGSDLYPLYP